MARRTAAQSAIPQTSPLTNAEENSPEMMVGRKLRALRARAGLSLRALAERSGLNVNTLSLIENGKSSPSVSTLQQLARSLGVQISAFFEVDKSPQRVVFTQSSQQAEVLFGSARLQDLGSELKGSTIQPFLVSLQPGADSGESIIVHTGYEFVYCLSGTVEYRVDGEWYIMHEGDSLIFEAHLPHCWQNRGSNKAQILLVLFPSDVRDQPGERHFSVG